MTTGLSPREVIEQLDVEQIDAEIAELKDEISALQALRRVATAKNGEAGKSRRNGAASRNGRQSSSAAEKLDHAEQVLKEFGGPMNYKTLATRIGYPDKTAYWILRNAEKDDRFSVEGETISLASS